MDGKRKILKTGLTRRDFLRVTGIAAAGIVASHNTALSALAGVEAVVNNPPAALGVLDKRYTLGIANVNTPTLHKFAKEVLRLAGEYPPIYTQALLKNNRFRAGPNSGIEINCDTPSAIADTESDSVANLKANTIRQVSTHDHKFGRRNITNAHARPLLVSNGMADWGEDGIFYFMNEPESYEEGGTNNCASNYAKPTFQIDGHVSNTPPILESTTITVGNPPSTVTLKRISASALGTNFLRYKSYIEGVNKGHVLLPPSTINANFLGDGATAYWEEFFATVLETASNKLPNFRHLRALHVHGYSTYWPRRATCPGYGHEAQYDYWEPRKLVAEMMFTLRESVKKFRDRFLPSTFTGPLPLNFVLSETGPYWIALSNIAKFGDAAGYTATPYVEAAHSVWTGGFPNFMLGLTYWNSMLLYLTRRASGSSHLNLDVGAGFGNYTMMHTPYTAPFMYGTGTNSNIAPNITPKVQTFLKIDASKTLQTVSNQTLQKMLLSPMGGAISGVTSPSGEVCYDTGWTALDPAGSISGHNETRDYHMAPFGACYAAWSEVGGDAAGVFGKGWVNTTAQGTWTTPADAPVKIPAGTGNKAYSTVLIPFVKPIAGSSTYPEFVFRWRVQGEGSFYSHGKMYTLPSLFPEPKTIAPLQTGAGGSEFCWEEIVSFNGNPAESNEWSQVFVGRNFGPNPAYSEFVETAEMCPILIKNETGAELLLELQMQRTTTSTQSISIGRPVVLKNVACTWNRSQ